MDVLIMVRALSCAVKINRAVDLTSCSSLTPYLFFPRRAHKLGSLDLRSPILYLCMSSELESVTICIWYVYGNLVCVREMTCLLLNFHIPPKFELILLSFVLLCYHARDQDRIDVQDRRYVFHV